MKRQERSDREKIFMSENCTLFFYFVHHPSLIIQRTFNKNNKKDTISRRVESKYYPKKNSNRILELSYNMYHTTSYKRKRA
jgi:hypothetical protein